MANDLDRIVGARVRLIRIDKGLSQDALGRAVGVSFQQVQKYERGVNRIGASTLVIMAKALSVPINAFFADIEEQAQEETASSPGLPFETREGIRVAKAFGSIRDAETRRQILNLVTCLADPRPSMPSK